MIPPSKHDAPVPQGKYVAACRYGDLVYTAGMTPRQNGVLQFVGKISPHKALDMYRDPVVMAVKNALAAARNVLVGEEKIAKVVSFTVYIAAEDSFQAHTQLADFASAYLYQELGADGIGSRVAVGVASLPSNAPVEIQLIAAIAR